MIRVQSITVYKAGESEKIFYEYFRAKQFTSYKYIQQWTESLEREYEKAFRMPVKVYPVCRAKPKKEVDMMAVLMNTAEVMGQNIDDVIASSRKRVFVDVRKVACMILMDEFDYNPMDIEKKLPFKNRVVYDYRVKMENRISLERGYELEYEAIKKQVCKIISKNDNKSSAGTESGT